MGYSQISVVEAGRMAYVSGQCAWRTDGTPIPKDLAEQTRLAAQSAKAALDALAAGPEDIAILRCYIKDLTPDRLNQAFPVLLEMLDGAEPSLTGIGVAALALPDLQIELELTVRLPA
ncbi:hypothetical protein GCM10007094_21660 [Pseudovibrio japonicus]|uniref:Uncharacterized protein n=2 Tax=Pseudovibrio japonicus TaxID=366534 RepID=A0ABQ3EBE5_9HYPH|nr:hypothetical protein GCM10007094_21660 [Pseudovibrio japonicus]